MLQKRNKWTGEFRNIETSEIVLITDEALLSNKWILGHIFITFISPDDLTRVVEVKTCTSVLKRSTHNFIL